MRWYWAIACDNTVRDPMVVDSAALAVEPERLKIGRPLDAAIHTGILSVSKARNDGTPDDVLQNHLGLPIYSLRLRRALDDAGVSGAQYLPVKVTSFDGREIEGFAVANVFARDGALDLAKSDLDVFPDDYFIHDRQGCVRAIRKATLIASRLSDCDVARVREFLSGVYVSTKFKETFERLGFSGYSFREVATT
jgi:hypothetical protein